MPVHVPSFRTLSGDNTNANEHFRWRIAKTVNKSKVDQHQQQKHNTGQNKRFSLLLDSIRRRSKSADPRGISLNSVAKHPEPDTQPQSILATRHLIDTSLLPCLNDEVCLRQETACLNSKYIIVSDPAKGSVMSFRDSTVNHKQYPQSHCFIGQVKLGEDSINQSNCCNRTSQIRPTSFHPGMSEKPWQTSTHFNPYLYQSAVKTSIPSGHAGIDPNNSAVTRTVRSDGKSVGSTMFSNGAYFAKQLNHFHTGISHRASVTLDSISAYSDSRMQPCHRIRTANQPVTGRIARPISEFWPDPSSNYLIDQSYQCDKGGTGKPMMVNRRSDWDPVGAYSGSYDAAFTLTTEKTRAADRYQSHDNVVSLKPSQSANVLQANDAVNTIPAYTPRWLLSRGVTGMHTEPYQASGNAVNGCYCSSSTACGCSPPPANPRRPTVGGVDQTSSVPVTSDHRLPTCDARQSGRAVWERRMRRQPASESMVPAGGWTGDRASPGTKEYQLNNQIRGRLDGHSPDICSLKCSNDLEGRIPLARSTCSAVQHLPVTRPTSTNDGLAFSSTSAACTTSSRWPGHCSSTSSRNSAYCELSPTVCTVPACEAISSAAGINSGGTSTQRDLPREANTGSISCNYPTNLSCSPHDNANSRRPKSAMFVPAGCLPPPIGSQLIANEIRQAQRQTQVADCLAVTANSMVSSRVLPNGTTLESFVGAGQQQAQQRHSRSRQQHNRQHSSGDTNRPPVSVRPPKPPLRTTSLVRETGDKTDDCASTHSSGVDPSSTSPSAMRSARSTPNKHLPTTSLQANQTVQPGLSTDRLQEPSTTTTTTTTTAPPPLITTSTLSDKHHAATPAPASLAPTSSLSEATWWSHLLPYKASNLPTNLADRLRQRSSLVFSRPSSPQQEDAQTLYLSNQFLAHHTSASEAPAQLTEMMTQSLYVQPSSSADQSLLPPALQQWQQPRRRSRTAIRPTSLCTERLYDQRAGHEGEATAFHLPSLAHLTSSTQSVNKNCPTGLTPDDTGKTGRCRPASVRPSSLALSMATNRAATPSPPPSPPRQNSATTAGSAGSEFTGKYANPSALSGSLVPMLRQQHQNDSPVLGQYCRLLILRSADGIASPPTPTNATALSLTPCRNTATNSEVSTPSADLTLVAASPHLFRT